MNFQRSYLIALFVSLLSTSAFGQTVVMFPLEATNLSPGEAESVGVLMAMAYEHESSLETLRPTNPKVLAAEGDTEIMKAQTLGASQYIEGTLIKLGSKYLFAASLRDRDGTLIHRSEMTGTSLDDMQAVTRRVALALHQKSSAEATRDKDNITKSEGRTPNRTFTEKLVGAKVEVVVPVAAGRRFDTSMSLLFDGRFESDDYFLEFGFGVMLPTGAIQGRGVTHIGGLVSEIGASYYLNNDPTSFYVGGGIIPRLMMSSSDDDNDLEAASETSVESNGGVRLAIYAQVGAMLFRNAGTRLFADLRVAQNVVPFSLPNGKSFFPTEFIFDVGIAF